MKGLCNDLCKRYEANHTNFQGSAYEHGLFRCISCQVYLEKQSVFISPGKRRLCPCCKTPVRSKSRWKKNPNLMMTR